MFITGDSVSVQGPLGKVFKDQKYHIQSTLNKYYPLHIITFPKIYITMTHTSYQVSHSLSNNISQEYLRKI